MVKGSNLTKRRFYRKRRMSFLKAISNYSYVKFSTCDRIGYDGTGIKLIVANSPQYGLYQYLDKCVDWGTYKTLYASYKVVALKLTIVPLTPQEGFATVHSAAIAYAANTDQVDLPSTIESNKSIMLSPYTKVGAYWRLNGGLTGWENSNSPSQTPGRIQVAATGNPSSGGIVWSVRFDIYVMFKNTI